MLKETSDFFFQPGVTLDSTRHWIGNAHVNI